ncbi:MAG: lactonase family protein [Bacteroides sp.]|nr:lactonase family protein [Bacteroides sp.]MCI1683336.1 lactonase family protein [Bacteroides sp.]
MKKLFFCMIAIALIACGKQSTKTGNESKKELAMLVGTYTNGTSKGIYTFHFNQETGIAQPLDSITVPNPSYLTPSADGKLVYAVSEMSDSTAALNAFTFDRQTGSLHLLNRQLTKGADPCYVSTNGKEVLTANYSGGSMSVFGLNKDGSLLPADTLFSGNTGGPDPVRQAQAHVHCTLFSPDGKYIFATDFSADRILRFIVSPNTIAPHPLPEAIKVDADFGPRHLTFSPNGKHAYVIGELSGKITIFKYNDGNLSAIQTVIADTLQARGSADIHLSPDGRYLYASNRLKGDGIAIFKVNEENGTLTKVSYQATGIHTRNFNITPNGKYLLAACRDSNVIQVFKRDQNTGLLIDTGKNIKLDKPVCIRFIP